MSPTVALELAPEGRRAKVLDGISAAEHVLQTTPGAISEQDRRQLQIQAWWARMWRDEDSPYTLVELTPAQAKLAGELARQIDPRCFPAARPGYVTDHRDTRIICEALALGATVLLTSNMRTIDHQRVNDWAVAHGDRLGFRGTPVLYLADEALLLWTEDRHGLEQWIEAGIMASWPMEDDRPAGEVIQKTINDVTRMIAGTGGRLPGAGERLVRGLQTDPDPESFVERVRERLPSPTIETDRQHPTYPTPPGAEHRG